jgi:membrane fusion protein (multidrug efflux system)
MKREVIAALFVLSLAAAGCRKSEAAKAPPPPPTVYVEAAVQHDEPVVHEWIGTADGDVNAEIRPKVEGYLLRRAYVEGRVVRQGDVLFEIDPRQFQAQLRQAEANLAQAAASVAKTDRDVARFEPLAAQRAISQQELDNARSAQEAAHASYGALKAIVEQARLNLSWTHVTSPINGVAGIAKAQVGNLVNPQSVLTTVSDVDPIRVEFQMSEQEYLRYQNDASLRNAPLDLILADGRVFPYKGRIAMSGSDVNIGTGTITVIGLFPNPGNLLRPGQYAKVRAVMEVRRGAILIPQRAVNELQGVYQIAVVGPDDKAEVRTVKPSARIGTSWMIDEGLRAGERVVVEGFARVKDGEPVIPKAAPAVEEGAK